MTEQQFESILRQALRPEIEPAALTVHVRPHRKGYSMNIRHFIRKACTAAAIIAVLTTTVYAADALNIKTLLTGSSSRVYETVEQAEEKAGFQIDAKEEFSNGYTFTGAHVSETKGLDKDDRVRLTYKEISVTLKNAAGEKLSLIAHQDQEAIPHSELSPQQTRRIGETVLCYRVDHYKFVPADYVQTEADKIWLQQPGNFMSYGSDTVQEEDVAFLTWEKDGICYTLMDTDASERPDSLFSMAEELVLSGK